MQEREVAVEAPARREAPAERQLETLRGLAPDLRRERRLSGDGRDQVVLDDPVARDGPFQGAVEGQTLGADLDLIAGRELEAGQRLRQRDQAVHRVGGEAVLGVERAVRRRVVDEAEPVAERPVGPLEPRSRLQVFPIERRHVEAHAGEERELVRQDQPVLGEDRGLARLRGVGRTGPPVLREQARIVAGERHAGGLVEVEVVGVAEIDVVHVEPGHELVRQPEQAPAERRVEAVSDLLLAVVDLQVVAPVHEPGAAVVAVLLDVEPVAPAGEPVGGVADRDVGRGGPLGLELGPVVGPGDLRVADVVVVEPYEIRDPSLDQRGAPVARGLLVAEIVAQGEGEVGARPEQQGGGDREVAEIALRPHPAVGAVAADVEAVREGVAVLRLAQRAAGIEGEPRDPVGADDRAGGVDRHEDRLLGHHVDDAADGAVAVEHRGRPAQHLDPLDVPRVEREGHGVGADVEARAVVELLDRVRPGEAAGRERAVAVAGRRDGGDAGRVLGHGLGDRILSAEPRGLARHDVEAGRRLQRRQAEATRGPVGRAQVEAVRREAARVAARARDGQLIQGDRLLGGGRAGEEREENAAERGPPAEAGAIGRE